MPKINFVVEAKRELAQNVVKLEISTDQIFECKSGQILSILVAPKMYRSYSIMDIDLQPQKQTIHLLISTLGDGPGTTFVNLLREGDSLVAIGPSGKFGIINNSHPKVFVATGTGIAPFVGMIKASLIDNPDLLHKVYFGQGQSNSQSDPSWGKKLFEELLENKSFEFITCFSPSRDKLEDAEFNGRVTAILPMQNINWETCDYYLCGNPNMINEVIQILKTKNVLAENIYRESFGLSK